MSPLPQPPITDTAPTDDQVTDYDRAHVATYLRLLDAVAEGAAWDEITGIVLQIDPTQEPDRARRAFDSHLSRARWLSGQGYRGFLRPKV